MSDGIGINFNDIEYLKSEILSLKSDK